MALLTATTMTELASTSSGLPLRLELDQLRLGMLGYLTVHIHAGLR